VSDTYYDDDEYQDGPKALREAYEKLKKQAEAQAKELAAEKEARAKAETLAKSQSITSILRDKGVKPGLAKWLEKDAVDATPEAVDAWLKENGEFFNVKPAEPDAAVDKKEAEPEGKANVSPELDAAVRQSQGLDASGVSATDVNALNKIRSIKDDYSVSEDAIFAALAEAGVEIG
jgi:hypothetical protein